MNIIIGIDPDSSKHGVAIYRDGQLETLACLPLMELMQLTKDIASDIDFDSSIEVHIEDVNAKKAVWHGKQQSKAAYGMTSQNVAKCKQAQLEAERMFEYLGIKVVKHSVSSKWKSPTGKKEFERVTGWSTRSNEDNRSAAWFGFIGVKLNK